MLEEIMPILENFMIIVGFAGVGMINMKLVQQILTSNLEGYKALRNDEKTKDYSIIALLSGNHKGVDINSNPPKADTHMKQLMLAINDMRDETMIGLSDLKKDISVINISIADIDKRVKKLEGIPVDAPVETVKDKDLVKL